MLALINSRLMVGMCGNVICFHLPTVQVLSCNYPCNAVVVQFTGSSAGSCLPCFVGLLYIVVVPFIAVPTAYVLYCSCRA